MGIVKLHNLIYRIFGNSGGAVACTTAPRAADGTPSQTRKDVDVVHSAISDKNYLPDTIVTKNVLPNFQGFRQEHCWCVQLFC